jgi:hypothetical protein
MMGVGTIEIRVFRESYGKPSGDIETSSDGFLTKNGENVSEAVLKGTSKSHGTT